MNDKELDKEITKKMTNPYFLKDENIKIGFKLILESHNNIQANFLPNIVPNFPDIGTETRCIYKIL